MDSEDSEELWWLLGGCCFLFHVFFFLLSVTGSDGLWGLRWALRIVGRLLFWRLAPLPDGCDDLLKICFRRRMGVTMFWSFFEDLLGIFFRRRMAEKMCWRNHEFDSRHFHFLNFVSRSWWVWRYLNICFRCLMGVKMFWRFVKDFVCIFCRCRVGAKFFWINLFIFLIFYLCFWRFV